MMADNATGNAHIPWPQLGVPDIVVISLYCALNVAVGIWVRGWGGIETRV